MPDLSTAVAESMSAWVRAVDMKGTGLPPYFAMTGAEAAGFVVGEAVIVDK
jgi:hypothetical protein